MLEGDGNTDGKGVVWTVVDDDDNADGTTPNDTLAPFPISRIPRRDSKLTTYHPSQSTATTSHP